MNKKVIVSTLAISALAVNVFAQGSNLGPNGTANGDASLILVRIIPQLQTLHPPSSRALKIQYPLQTALPLVRIIRYPAKMVSPVVTMQKHPAVTPSRLAPMPKAWWSTPSLSATKLERRPMIVLLSVMARSYQAKAPWPLAVPTM